MVESKWKSKSGVVDGRYLQNDENNKRKPLDVSVALSYLQ